MLLGAPFDKLDNLMAVCLLASAYTLPHTFTLNFKKQVGINLTRYFWYPHHKTYDYFNSNL